MTLTELINEVYTATNRPDLVTQTRQKVKEATLKLHSFDGNLFKQDLKRVVVTPEPVIPNTFRYQLDLSNAVTYPRFRAVSTIREHNTIPTGREKEYEPKDANDIIDNYGFELVDYFYQIGLAVNIVASSAPTQLAVTYYQHPDVTDAGFSSWIANQYPYAIIKEASRDIFKMVGKDEEFQRMEVDMRDYKQMILAAGI